MVDILSVCANIYSWKIKRRWSGFVKEVITSNNRPCILSPDLLRPSYFKVLPFWMHQNGVDRALGGINTAADKISRTFTFPGCIQPVLYTILTISNWQGLFISKIFFITTICSCKLFSILL